MGSSASTNRTFNANQVLSRSYNTTDNFISVKDQIGDRIPSSLMYDTTELGQWVIQRNYEYTIHPFRTTYLTSDGVQYLTAVAASTAVSSKTSNCSEAVSSTINWPGLDGSFIDEIEFGLTAGIRAATATVSTVGYFWQWKNSTVADVAANWKYLTAAKTEASTVSVDRTLSGYAKTGSGYNKLPINVRLLFWAKTASKGSVKAKSSSYIKIKAKKTS
ncbi:hypothetical protein LCGC14_0773040 [marine sediment metagenome]|uniref:Uncharacterized protein n=1 Tax=marine sediment metagenome TaxID=412755 RepID=A0A0F9SHN8_9ZZZZ